MKTPEEQKKYLSNYGNTHHISDIKDVPDRTHFAILVNDQHQVNDYYSKDGGSYATHHVQYIVFDNEEALNGWVLDKSNASKKYKVVSVNRVDVVINTTVTIKK